MKHFERPLIYGLVALFISTGADAQDVSKETRETLLREGVFLRSVPRDNEYGATPIDLEKPVVSRDMEPTPAGEESNYQKGLFSYFARDYPSAMSLWLPLAEAGDASAQAGVGWMFQQGLGVEVDYRRAVEWLSRAATQGHVVAQNNLGACFENGWGVVQDYAQAVAWYTRSARANYKYAQYNLGVLLWNGRGAERNIDEAKSWFAKSAAQGVTQANDYLK